MSIKDLIFEFYDYTAQYLERWKECFIDTPLFDWIYLHI